MVLPDKPQPSPHDILIAQKSVVENEIETKRGNYLLLTSEEAEAIRQYTSRGHVMMNMVFNTDIVSVLPRLKHWARADENIESSLNLDVVSNVINLYGALLKSYDYHRDDDDLQKHPAFLFRGSTGNHHSDGFKSFTKTRAMAESFGNKVFEVPFPEDIPYLSKEDIYNYAPNTSRREETEYLFSPFCDIKPLYSKNDHFFPRSYTLSKIEIEYSLDNLPSDINENLKVMANTISKYTKNTRTIEDLERRQNFDSDFEKASLEHFEIVETYKKISEQVLNFIAYQCAKLNTAHEK